jgi:ribonuclease P protein component
VIGRIGRIVRSADFERVLASSSRMRSIHFAVHHIAACPSKAAKVLSTAAAKLSTGDAQVLPSPVDDLPKACWLGAIVPKRHARRSVTRSLLKRQIRAAFDGHSTLPPGLWVVRLRTPFDRKLFPSAASEALRSAAHAELAQLVERVLARVSA